MLVFLLYIILQCNSKLLQNMGLENPYTNKTKNTYREHTICRHFQENYDKLPTISGKTATANRPSQRILSVRR